MLIPFRKTHLKKILEKHKKLFDSNVFKMVISTNDDLMKMFDDERIKCKYFNDNKCKHKNGNGNCFILDCPFR